MNCAGDPAASVGSAGATGIPMGDFL